MKALVTGATGFVGRHLLARLDRPVVLSRDAERARQSLTKFNAEAFAWDPLAGPAPPEAFRGVDTVFHLAGDPVAEGRWTAEKKQRIRDSRVIGTRNLVAGVRQLSEKPRVLVSASAVGYYGSRGDEVLDESASPATGDFLADVCRGWEAEAQAATELGIRVVSIRAGVVFGPDGGALQKMLMPFKLGMGGPLGKGHQWVAWIHVDDLVSLFMHATANETLSGPVNGTAPNPVTNKEFAKALGAALHRPAVIPTPYFALRAMLGEFAKILFDSQRVVPKKALASGFQFRYPEIGPALEACVKS